MSYVGVLHGTIIVVFPWILTNYHAVAYLVQLHANEGVSTGRDSVTQVLYWRELILSM